MNQQSLLTRLGTPTTTASIALLLFAALLPGLLGHFHINLLITVMILGLFGLSFNLLFGYTGLLSFGQAAYFGIAAYTFAITSAGRTEMIPELPLVLAAIVAVLTATVLAAAFGVICVQRGEIYFAMLTLALSMMVYQAANQWNNITGGEEGLIVNAPPLEFGGLTLNLLDVGVRYYLTLILLLASMVVLWRVIHSPYGALLITIRENPQRAELIGIPVKRYQFSSFVIAGCFAGIAGVLYSLHNFVVSTGILHWSTSAEPILMTLMGGPSSFFGPLIGAFLFIFLEEVLTTVTEYWQFGLGLILIPLVLFVPGGVASLLEDFKTESQSILDRRLPNRSTDDRREQE